jgi:hypothetical protein
VIDGGRSDGGQHDGGEEDAGQKPDAGHPPDECGDLTVSDTPACQSCMEAQCCSELLACAEGTPCGALNQCLQACSQDDSTCSERCTQEHSDGFFDFKGVGACLQHLCDSECT